MKELSTEEKAKRYDEALGRAKEIHAEDRAQPFDVMLKVFPELKESEDEKMRKSIIYALQNGGFYNKDKTDEAIAWLEKQGEQKHETPIPRFNIGDWVIVHNKYAYQVIGVNTYDYRLQHYLGGKMNYPFKYESDLKPWTIQDAKDGDVLVASDGSIFLFAGVDDCACKYYVALTTDNVVNFNEGLKHYWETSRAVHPATKEQRDLLFQKMKEAGLEWDAENKELKKIKYPRR